jgi:hypothetical protein
MAFTSIINWQLALKKINLNTIESKTKVSFESKEDKSNRISATNLQLI